jgi:uncharacterized protein (DUF736 family)
MTYGRPSSPETLVHTFFPRRVAASSRALRFKKPVPSGPPLRCGLRRFWLRAAAISGHASPGNGSQAKTSRRIPMTAIGYVRKENDGRYTGSIRTISIRADIDIVPNAQKTSDSHPDFRVLTQGIEIGAGWSKTGETSGKDYVSLSLAAPEFGPKKLYANLGRAAGQEDENLYAVIWNAGD